LRRERKDPLLTRRAGQDERRLAETKRMTFAQCAEGYITAHQDGWRNPKTTRKWRQSLETYAGPVLGKLPVPMIDTGLVLRVLEAERLRDLKPLLGVTGVSKIEFQRAASSVSVSVGAIRARIAPLTDESKGRQPDENQKD
jgi:hypothetical protein